MELKGKKFKIKKQPAEGYFFKKYGTASPEIIIEDRDINVFGRSWMMMDGNPACMLFGLRLGSEREYSCFTIPAYYGKVQGLGELVLEDELEEVI